MLVKNLKFDEVLTLFFMISDNLNWNSKTQFSTSCKIKKHSYKILHNFCVFRNRNFICSLSDTACAISLYFNISPDSRSNTGRSRLIFTLNLIQFFYNKYFSANFKHLNIYATTYTDSSWSLTVTSPVNISFAIEYLLTPGKKGLPAMHTLSQK